MSESLLSKAEKIIRKAEAQGARQAEALVYSFDDSSTRFSRNLLEQSAVYSEYGIYLRIKRNDESYVSAFIKTLDEEILTKTISLLLKQPKTTKHPPFSATSKTQPLNNTYDNETAKLTDEKRAESVKIVIETTLSFDKKVVKTAGTLTTRVAHLAITNTLGLCLTHKYTTCSLICTTLAEENGSIGVGYSSQNSRRFSEINIEEIAKEAAEDAVLSINPKPISLGRYQVLFQSDAAGDIIGSFVQLGFSTQREANYVEIGDACASELLTVSDEPLNLETLIPRPFDAEGTPTANLVLIDRGIAKAQCFDNKLAVKSNKRSTGHAIFPHDITYSSKSFVGWVYYPSNQVVKPGNTAKQDMISESKRAILIKRLMYAGLPSGVSDGDIIQAHTMGTWLIENGQIKHAVPSMRISYSLKKIVKGIIDVGDQGTVKKLGCINVPWLASKDILFTEISSLSVPEGVW